MINNKFYILVKFFLAILILPSLVSASEINREQNIAKEMDCVQEQLDVGQGVTWADVCNLFSGNRSNDRIVLVKQALDNLDPNAPIPEVEFETQQIQLPVSENQIKDIKASPKTSKFIEYELNANVGMRWDQLKWNIADSDGNPDVLSELTWKKLQLYEQMYSTKMIVSDHFVLEGMLAKGSIFEGETQDSDYLSSGRGAEFSRSLNSAGDGSSFDWSLDGGLRLNVSSWIKALDETTLVTPEMWLSLLAGYSHHEQNLRAYNGVQIIPATGSFPNLNSSYDTVWAGPWLGLDFSGRQDKIHGFSRFEYHWADYDAEANWNLRNDFMHPKSFEHEAKGIGVVFSGGGAYDLTEHWSVNLNLKYSHWETRHGTDRVFLSNGSISETKLNEVVWDSFSASLGAGYKF